MPSWIPALLGAPTTVITANRDSPPAIGKYNAIRYNSARASGLLRCLLMETSRQGSQDFVTEFAILGPLARETLAIPRQSIPTRDLPSQLPNQPNWQV
jgi:hypothetical protein